MKEKGTKSKRKSFKTILVILVCGLMIATGTIAVLRHINDSWDNDNNPSSLLKRFSSYDELREYVRGPRQGGVYYDQGLGDLGISPAMSDSGLEFSSYQLGPGLISGGSTEPSSPRSDYSGTNIQVEGVDEADIVKTDGTYLYAVTGNELAILKAYPAGDAKVISRIHSDNNPIEIFVNGNKLVVFEEPRYEDYYGNYGYYLGYRSPDPVVTIRVYDISLRSNPVQTQTVTTGGYYLDSRLIDDYVYVIVNKYIQHVYDDITLPWIEKNGARKNIRATEIGYFDVPASYYTYSIVLSVNIKINSLGYEVCLTDSAQNVYASTENIYLTSTDYSYSSPDVPGMWGGDTEIKTWIHKIAINSGQIQYVYTANVPGRTLNQFSMDEYDGYLRIATEDWDDGTNVYVLDEALELTGKLEKIAPGETMHSARFMGDRGYLVTFKKIDPFFVIDLTYPQEPKILGELKIPGYSDYLHPYDEDHIIGIGKNTVDMGSFAWFQGVKMSLFDVTDVENPKEVSNYSIGDRGTNSIALNDHKAFLFSRSKDLLIIPILLAEIDESRYGGYVPPSAYGEYVYQGAYVFSLTLDEGFELKGRITHVTDDEDLKDYWYDAESYVKRSLYIENNIYTVSEKTVKINNMDTMAEVKKVDL